MWFWHSEDRASWYILIIKANNVNYFTIYFGKELYMFRTYLLSIIRSLNSVYTAIRICHASYVDKYLLLCIQCWDSWWWTIDLFETYRVLYQNKFVKECISLAFIIRIRVRYFPGTRGYCAWQFLQLQTIWRKGQGPCHVQYVATRWMTLYSSGVVGRS
jgi:hypothetical protein